MCIVPEEADKRPPKLVKPSKKNGPRVEVKTAEGMISVRTPVEVEALRERIEAGDKITRVEFHEPFSLMPEVMASVVGALSVYKDPIEFQIGKQIDCRLLHLWLEQAVTTSDDTQRVAWLETAVLISATTQPEAVDAAAKRISDAARNAKFYAPTVKEIAKRIRQAAGLQASENRISAVKVAEQFITARVHPADDGDGWLPLVYDCVDWHAYTDRGWMRKTDANIELQISQFLTANYPSLLTKRFIDDMILALKSRVQIELPVHGHAMYRCDDGRIKPVRALGCGNGTLLLDDLLDGVGDVRHEPPSPRYFTPSTIPVEFDPSATCPRFLRFLEEVLPRRAESDQRMLLLQQLAGYCLAGPHLRLERFFILHGRGANGKSIFALTLTALLGDENVSHLTIPQLNHRFMVHELSNKIANIAMDLSEVDKADEGVLKSLTSFEPQTVDRKHKAPVKVKPFVKLVFATNVLPHIKDNTDGIARRMVIVPFLETFAADRADVRLLDELSKELPGILNWALEGLKSLIERQGQFANCDGNYLF